MTDRPEFPAFLSRRTLLRHLGRGALGAGAAVMASRAQAQDQTLQLLMEQTRRSDFGQTYDAGIRSVRMPKSSLPTLSPQTVQTTEAAIPRYEQIVAQGGWTMVPPSDRLRLGNRNKAVIALRRRLITGGDLATSAGVSDVFDSFVEAGVRRFQARHGLTVDGIVREATLNALNIPAEQRLAQLKTNLVRLKSFSGSLGPKFVMCNIPAAQIEAIENGVAITRHTAVVGKPDRASPDINSKIVEVNFNPFWTVPVSIVKRDLIPKMQEEPDYLTKQRIRIIDARGTAVREARELAESASTKAAAAAAEYDRKLNAARADVYAQLDETRRAALDQRARLLAETRQAVERDTQAATARVAQESAAARASLDREASDLANAIVARVLDRAS